MSYMQEASKELAQAPERAVDVLLNEVLDSVEQQFILVLDDYHHLGGETPVHRVVDRLLAYLPDLIHVVIISRDMPPLALARMRTQSNARRHRPSGAALHRRRDAGAFPQRLRP